LLFGRPAECADKSCLSFARQASESRYKLIDRAMEICVFCVALQIMPWQRNSCANGEQLSRAALSTQNDFRSEHVAGKARKR
jgi:hypothetical protein